MTAKDDKAQALAIEIMEAQEYERERTYLAGQRDGNLYHLSGALIATTRYAAELLALRDEVAAKKAESNTLLLQVARLMAEVSRQCPPALAVSILTAARLRPLTENKENTDASRD